MKLTLYLTPITKFKIVKDLNIRPESMKLLEQNMGIKHKINNKQLELRQTKKLLQSKEMNKVKRHPAEWEQIFLNHISHKGLVPEYQRNHRFNSKKQKTQANKNYNEKSPPACNNGYHKKTRDDK